MAETEPDGITTGKDPTPIIKEDYVRPLINVGEFQREWEERLGSVEVGCFPVAKDSDEVIAEKMGITTADVEDLVAVCGEGTLTVDAGDGWAAGPPTGHTWSELVMGEAKQLATVALRYINQTPTGRWKRNPKGNRTAMLGDYSSMFRTDCGAPRAPRDEVPTAERVPTPNVVLMVSVVQAQVPKIKSNIRVDRDYMVYGGQTLVELKDAILCPSDWTSVGPTTGNINKIVKNRVTAKEKYKSSFFYIEGVFYDDKRAGCHDYSSFIVDWASERTRGLGPFRTNSMDARFNQLSIRMGQPYLYCHQGDCEHLFVFRDLRMLHPSDPQCATAYPWVVARTRFPRVVCMVCRDRSSQWCITRSHIAPTDPAFLCDRCCRVSHYDQMGRPYNNCVQLNPFIDPGVFN